MGKSDWERRNWGKGKRKRVKSKGLRGKGKGWKRKRKAQRAKGEGGNGKWEVGNGEWGMSALNNDHFVDGTVFANKVTAAGILYAPSAWLSIVGSLLTNHTGGPVVKGNGNGKWGDGEWAKGKWERENGNKGMGKGNEKWGWGMSKRGRGNGENY